MQVSAARGSLSVSSKETPEGNHFDMILLLLLVSYSMEDTQNTIHTICQRRKYSRLELARDICILIFKEICVVRPLIFFFFFSLLTVAFFQKIEIWKKKKKKKSRLLSFLFLWTFQLVCAVRSTTAQWARSRCGFSFFFIFLFSFKFYKPNSRPRQISNGFNCTNFG